MSIFTLVKPPLIAIAPMMDYTHRHFRYFMRLISRRVQLYTEMITTAAILHGDQRQLLDFSAIEQPLVLQLGGSEPQQLAKCARIAEQWGYAEVNLNVGCPSPQVQKGQFGACLIKQPMLVAECVAAMSAATALPITVKTRIGVDEYDSYAHLCHFIECVEQAGCHTFILHARKAWLKGLSPKQNREIPPLRYKVVQQIKQDFPQLTVILNGGINSLLTMKQHLQNVDGVMIGRTAYQNPYLFADIDSYFYQDAQPVPSREQIIVRYLDYVEQQLCCGAPKSVLLKPLQNIYYGVSGAAQWRRQLANFDSERIRTFLEMNID